MFSPFLCESSFTFNNNKLGGKAQRFRQRNTSLMNKIASRKSVLQKRVACIRRMQFKGLGFPNKHFATQNGLCIYEDTACYGYERLLNCKMIFQLLYWAFAQSAHRFLFAAIPVESWNDALSPWKSPAVWGKQGFGGKAAETRRFLMEQVIPILKQQLRLPENVKIILGGYSLAGLFALWASTQTDLFYGVAAASPSVWFPGWMEFEQQHLIQAQHIYLSLGDKEERTKNAVMAAVGDNIRTLHSRLAERGADCTLEWNSGGHFKNADLRTAKAFQWAMEEHT